MKLIISRRLHNAVVGAAIRVGAKALAEAPLVDKTFGLVSKTAEKIPTLPFFDTIKNMEQKAVRVTTTSDSLTVEVNEDYLIDFLEPLVVYGENLVETGVRALISVGKLKESVDVVENKWKTTKGFDLDLSKPIEFVYTDPKTGKPVTVSEETIRKIVELDKETISYNKISQDLGLGIGYVIAILEQYRYSFD